ncbi:MAG: LPS export ABC transporter periplasmic protein LptC [Rhodocyclales bacterium]|nr:LPS export ABC transporter periplasmic protein LptC [Rhodocyclales bacterium]
MRVQSLFPIALLTLLVGLTFWLERATELKRPGSDSLLRHDPDFFVENLRLRSFSPTGELQSTLAAIKMVHYPDDDTTLVTEPRVGLLKGPRPTQLTSQQGLVAPDGRQIVLVGNVRGVREATKTDPQLVLTTTHLTLLPDDDMMRTNAAVTVTQGASVARRRLRSRQQVEDHPTAEPGQ